MSRKEFRMIFWGCKWHCLPGTSLKSWPSPNKIRVWKCVLPIFSAMWWCVCISCTSASLYTLSEFGVSLKIYLKSWSGHKIVSAVMPSLNPAKNYLAAAIQIRHVMEVKKEYATLFIVWFGRRSNHSLIHGKVVYSMLTVVKQYMNTQNPGWQVNHTNI